MKKSTLLFISSFTIVFSIYLFAVITFQPELKKEISLYFERFLEAKKSKLVEVSESAPVKVEKTENLIPFSGRLKKDTYEEHLGVAGKQGLELIRNDYHLFQKVFESGLVKIEKGKGYQVDTLTHSFPYLTPTSKEILEEIGLAYEGLAGKDQFFTISSATRTEEQQNALKRRNRNATDGESSHSFGVSVDISYIRFNGIRNWDGNAQKNLETVLNHFQQTGKIYVIKERKQSCYHITFR